MFGWITQFDAHRSVARVVGILAILFGILLLQGSLCDGSMTSGVPCVGSCDEPLMSVAEDNHAAAEFVVDIDAPDDEGGLVSLCVTVLLAVLVALAIVRRPGISLVIPQARSAPPVARNHAPVLPQLCALRL